MQLTDLGIIYNKVPDIFDFKSGTIHGIYMVYKEKAVQFLVEIKFQKNGKSMKGLFGLDIVSMKILTLTKDESISFLNVIIHVNKKENYARIKKYLVNTETENNNIEFENYFLITRQKSEMVKYDSESFIEFKDISFLIHTESAVLYGNPGLSTSYARIKATSLDKNRFNILNFSTIVDLNIIYAEKKYNDYGNIKQVIKNDEYLDIIIESINTSLLESVLIDNIAFENVSHNEMIEFMAFSTKNFKIGEIANAVKSKRKFKFITTLNNFEIDINEIVIGEIILSKNINYIDQKLLNPATKKFIYISTYIIADEISEAQEIATKKIKDLINLIELIEKNSSFYEQYNISNNINAWKLSNLFIDYELGKNFYIFNITNPKQKIYGTFSNILLKKYGLFEKNSEIVKYQNEISKKIYKYENKLEKNLNAVYWLNKGIDEISIDLERCIIYLNIALEYCVSDEKGVPITAKYPNAENIFNDILEYIKNKYEKDSALIDIEKLINNNKNNASVQNKFENMLKNSNIKYTDLQLKNYKKIREARNDIIHGRKIPNIQKIDIIEFYMFLSKILYHRIMENKK